MLTHLAILSCLVGQMTNCLLSEKNTILRKGSVLLDNRERIKKQFFHEIIIINNLLGLFLALINYANITESHSLSPQAGYSRSPSSRLLLLSYLEYSLYRLSCH